MKYHVGCGKRYIPGWIHIDKADYDFIDGKDVWLKDVKNNTAEIIYASHLLEYFSYDESIELVKAWHGKLKPGGILRLSVPDFKKLVAVYQCNERIRDIIGPLFGKMECGDETIYHKNVFDYWTLESLLLNAGFKDFREWNFRETDHWFVDDHSRAHFPHDEEAIKTGIFGSHQIMISLNIEAVK